MRFMAAFLNTHGRRAVAVHAGAMSAPRAASLGRLASGQLDVICAVNVFNEGLDLPDLDTLLMLRPTESRIVWLQQFGRGLRKTAEHKVDGLDFGVTEAGIASSPEGRLALARGQASRSAASRWPPRNDG